MTAPRTDDVSAPFPPRSASGAVPRTRTQADSDDARFEDEDFAGASRQPRAATRARAKRTLLDTIRQIPAYLRLLGGLLIDRRVSTLDKALVAGAIAYVVSPIDLIPDFIPFIGEVDDVFVMMLALQRLVANAGPDVLHDHWRGDPDEIHALNVKEVMGAATLFLPGSVRGKLVDLTRRSFQKRRG